MRTLLLVLKRVLLILLILIIGINAVILFTGRYYLYKGIWNTYLSGKMHPGIDEYGIFTNRKVKTGILQPWKKSAQYNKAEIPADALNEMKRLGTIAFLIIKNDSLYYEQYWDGFSDTSHTNSFSMAKSIVSILTGIAIKEGKIKDVNEKVYDFIPQYKEGMDTSLCIYDLLTMSSGINFLESYSNPFAYPAEAYYGSDLMSITLKYKVVTEPGKQFKYLSGNSTLLGYILTKATGETLSDYASEKLWQPIGAENPAYWSLDHADVPIAIGMEKAYCCFNSNARDFARIGQLYLDSGKWNGKQIVPQDYVLASTHPALAPYYGYNWWILHCNGITIPYCRGIGGQYIFVIPEKHIVVVRLGREKIKVPENVPPPDGLTYIKAALTMCDKY
jgi:CubicO group peptidase (beta-lactamase class C family)